MAGKKGKRASQKYADGDSEQHSSEDEQELSDSEHWDELINNLADKSKAVRNAALNELRKNLNLKFTPQAVDGSLKLLTENILRGPLKRGPIEDSLVSLDVLVGAFLTAGSTAAGLSAAQYLFPLVKTTLLRFEGGHGLVGRCLLALSVLCWVSCDEDVENVVAIMNDIMERIDKKKIKEDSLADAIRAWGALSVLLKPQVVVNMVTNSSGAGFILRKNALAKQKGAIGSGIRVKFACVDVLNLVLENNLALGEDAQDVPGAAAPASTSASPPTHSHEAISTSEHSGRLSSLSIDSLSSRKAKDEKNVTVMSIYAAFQTIYDDQQLQGKRTPKQEREWRKKLANQVAMPLQGESPKESIRISGECVVLDTFADVFRSDILKSYLDSGLGNHLEYNSFCRDMFNIGVIKMRSKNSSKYNKPRRRRASFD